MATTKYVFDGISEAVHRVVGYAHTWEELGPGVRVRRRVVGPGPRLPAAHLEVWCTPYREPSWDGSH